jgi:hypothetical protein
MVIMQSQDISEKIKEWCFTQEPSTFDDHYHLQALLVKFLEKNGWMAYIEYELEKFPRLLVRKDKVEDRQGFIDVCGFAENKMVAIEYDSVTHLKPQSISKLLNVNADYAIGIVRGRQHKAFLRFENIAKIKRVARDSGIVNKSIFLIIVENRIAEQVNV